MVKINEVSVFFPAYNEEGSIRATVLLAKKVLGVVASKWEIIIVDDGSVDSTLEISSSLTRLDRRIKVIHHKTNKGYGSALQSGLYNAKSEWIVYNDADGQFDFSEIVNFIDTQRTTNADLVIGYYKDRKVSFSKKITSKMWEYLMFLMFGLKVKDIDCGFKLVSRRVVEGISRLESERGAFISSELLIKAKKKGFKIVEIPVTHYPRLKGSGTGRNLNVIIKSFIDLAKLWKKLR